MTAAFGEKALMNEIEGDIEFLEETVAMFVDDTPVLLEEIRSATSSGDTAALVKPAHTLKGLLGNFCASPAENSARKSETMAREGIPDGVQVELEILDSEVQRLKEALHQFLQARAT
jgi:HPt (histidine-containing phosphotransfer) domain-containing protein